MSYKQRGDEMFVFRFQMQRGDEMFILWNADTFFFSNLFNQQISLLNHTSQAFDRSKFLLHSSKLLYKAPPVHGSHAWLGLSTCRRDQFGAFIRHDVSHCIHVCKVIKIQLTIFLLQVQCMIVWTLPLLRVRVAMRCWTWSLWARAYRRSLSERLGRALWFVALNECGSFGEEE